MIFSRRRIETTAFQVRIDNTVIERKTEAKFLGVIVDEKLTWSQHIKAVRTKMARFTGLMYRIKNKLPLKARLQIFQSFVQSHINYCSLVWGFAAKSHIESLFTKQKQGMRAIIPGLVNYQYRNGKIPDHTKHAFSEYEILTVHGIIVKNALLLLHKVKNMPSKLPKSILELFPANIPEYGTTYEQNMDWLSTFSQKCLSASVFYKGPLLAVTDHNLSVTCPSSLFSLSIYKKNAKRVLLKLQGTGENDEWPPFLLYGIPGLRKSSRASQH